jgi:hypothetical protein
MNNYQKLYWLTRLDSINGFLTWGLLVFSIIIIASILYGWIADDYLMNKEQKEKLKNDLKLSVKIRNYCIYFLIIFSLIKTFLPSQKEAIFIIAGGKTIDFIEQDSSVQKIPSQATEIITRYFDKEIEELKK